MHMEINSVIYEEIEAKFDDRRCKHKKWDVQKNSQITASKISSKMKNVISSKLYVVSHLFFFFTLKVGKGSFMLYTEKYSAIIFFYFICQESDGWCDQCFTDALKHGLNISFIKCCY